MSEPARKSVSEMRPKELARLMADGWWRFETAEVRAGSTALPPRDVFAAYVNNIYSVQVSIDHTEWGAVRHLWIRRHNGSPVCPWADMQRIKDELVSPEALGVQVFPPRSELVDQANIYHLWVLPEGFRLPFSLKRGAQ